MASNPVAAVSHGEAACRNMLELLPGVLDARQRVVESARRSLGALGAADPGDVAPSDPIDYALLNHLLMDVRLAAGRRDAAAAAAAIECWQARAELPRAHGIVVLDSAGCVRRDMPGIGDPVYLVAKQAAPPDPPDHLGPAVAAVAAAGFAEVRKVGTGVVVRLGPAAEGQSPASYTLSFLPGTATMEWPASPALAGETLVHEGAHSWLNECLQAAGIRLPAEPLIHSPWRGTPRPPGGILHAAFAFSTVICYLASTQDAAVTERIEVERKIMEDHHRDIDDVIALVPDAEVRALVRRQVELALAA